LEETQPQPTEAATAQPAGPSLDSLLDSTNIAEDIDEEVLEEMGSVVYEGYEKDCASKRNWDNMIDEYVKLAAQVKEPKSWPWNKAANVKFPLLSTAALQFQARAYPSLVPADGKIVNMKVIGADPQGLKATKADKLAKHMNYQLLKEMKDWDEETDRLLIQLPIVGCLFRKTYFDQIKKHNVSRLLGPKDLVVNYWAPSLEGAYRKTEIMTMTRNELQAQINAGLFLDVELPDPEAMPKVPEKADVHKGDAPSSTDKATPYVILEQHTFWDIDDDGIDEPYIITIEHQSRKVLRVVARWDSDGVKLNDKKDVICFEPVEYYTKYEFLPNPDGGFYGVGFGHLLGPLNDSANTIINQLIDAGTLANLQSGFLGKGLRLKPGETRLAPGEWRNVNATGDDIKKQIFPLPVKEPSKVLFELLGLIIQSTKELASVAEIFVGKMPGQNTPATTTMASIEQGMKVFTSIYKRVYRSLAKEFEKLFRLNAIHSENLERAQLILDEPLSPEDYDAKTYDVCPTADPTAVSSTQKLLKAQGLMEILPLGTINVMEVTKRILEAQEQSNIEALMQPQQLPPDPKVQAAQMKMQQDKEKHQLDIVMKQFELQMKQQELAMDAKFMEMEKMMEFKLKEMEMQQDTQHSQVKHNMQMTQTVEKAYAQREAARVAPKPGNGNAKGSDSGKSGGSSGEPSQRK
jgi:chaperonin GroES